MRVRERHLIEMEEACIPVRKGDRNEIHRLSRPYLKKMKGIIAFLRGDSESDPVDFQDLFAASEALVMIGQYREAVTPLEEVIKTGLKDHKIKDLALARAGQIAVSRGLPMDLGPIVNELGLSRSDIHSAITAMKMARGKKEPLTEMERVLLQSMLLHQRTSWIESSNLSANHLRGAFEGFSRARDLADNLDTSIRDHHISRCFLYLGRFLLDVGNHGEGIDHVKRSHDIAFEIGSIGIELECLLTLGIWEENEEEAREKLLNAQKISSILRNHMALAEAGSIIGSRLCREGEKEGVDRLLNSAGIMQEVSSPMEASLDMVEAALWSIRLGDPARGVELAKNAYKVLKSTHDNEMLTRNLCVLFYGYIAADERKKAKKLLLEIVSNYPVKQFPESFAILREAVRDVKWLREDKDTAELFEEEIIYRISREAVNEIKQRAKEAYPNEFGAMLRGIENITRIEPIMEGASNRSSFMFSLFSRFSQREVPGEGVVHSHPSGSARPSRADISLFGRFPGINIIIAYPFEDDSMAAYDRMGNRVKLEIENN